jgi:hypothetical protein
MAVAWVGLIEALVAGLEPEACPEVVHQLEVVLLVAYLEELAV